MIIPDNAGCERPSVQGLQDYIPQLKSLIGMRLLAHPVVVLVHPTQQVDGGIYREITTPIYIKCLSEIWSYAALDRVFEQNIVVDLTEELSKRCTDGRKFVVETIVVAISLASKSTYPDAVSPNAVEFRARVFGRELTATEWRAEAAKRGLITDRTKKFEELAVGQRFHKFESDPYLVYLKTGPDTADTPTRQTLAIPRFARTIPVQDDRPFYAPSSGTRQVTHHQVNGANERLSVFCMDQPGQGGACHRYVVRGFCTDHNPSRGDELDCETSLEILFQNGSIKECGVNGLTNEALLAILIDRMEGFQSGKFACHDNQMALDHLQAARLWLAKRTLDRAARGVEGAHQP
jgi:hypothetical protein